MDSDSQRGAVNTGTTCQGIWGVPGHRRFSAGSWMLLLSESSAQASPGTCAVHGHRCFPSPCASEVAGPERTGHLFPASEGHKGADGDIKHSHSPALLRAEDGLPHEVLAPVHKETETSPNHLPCNPGFCTGHETLDASEPQRPRQLLGKPRSRSTAANTIMFCRALWKTSPGSSDCGRIHLGARSVRLLHFSRLQTGPFIASIMLYAETGCDNFHRSGVQIGRDLNAPMEVRMEKFSSVYDE